MRAKSFSGPGNKSHKPIANVRVSKSDIPKSNSESEKKGEISV